MGKKDNFFIKPEILQLMDIYYNEKNHRDSMYWKQMYYYYISAYMVALIPVLTESSEKFIFSIPVYIFEIISIIIAVFTLYVSFAYVERDKKIEEANRNLMKEIPFEFQIHSIEKSIFSVRIKLLLGIVICVMEIIFSISIMCMCK